MPANTLSKDERLCSRTAIEELFNGGSHRSMTVFPLRAVYVIRKRYADEQTLQMLVSVPKKCFKRAVKRNRVKRQVREAFRMAKQPLAELLTDRDETLDVAFIWLDRNLHSSEEVQAKVEKLLRRIGERL